MNKLRKDIEKITWKVWEGNQGSDSATDDILKLLHSHIERATVLLKSDIARAIGHMQGCGHPDRYLESRYPEFNLKKREKDGK